MMRLIFALALTLSACAPDPSATMENYEVERAVITNRVDAAVAKGDLTLSREYYRPNLTGERWFKVEDQFGCKWWINSGHKFDDSQIDVRQNGEANCPDPKYAPEKQFIYRDRSGRVVDIYNF